VRGESGVAQGKHTVNKLKHPARYPEASIKKNPTYKRPKESLDHGIRKTGGF
jgi:hypothetical protein